MINRIVKNMANNEGFFLSAYEWWLEWVLEWVIEWWLEWVLEWVVEWWLEWWLEWVLEWWLEWVLFCDEVGAQLVEQQS